LSTFYVQDPILDVQNTVVNKTNSASGFLELIYCASIFSPLKWGYSLVFRSVVALSRMHKTLGSIPKTAKKKNEILIVNSKNGGKTTNVNMAVLRHLTQKIVLQLNKALDL
jgi:hypothetical protein